MKTSTVKKAPQTTTPKLGTRLVSLATAESTHSPGAYTYVTARFEVTLPERVTAAAERGVEAFGHPMVADILDATGAAERWGAACEVTGSWGSTVNLRVSIELAEGDAAEMKRAQALLTQVLAAPARA